MNSNKDTVEITPRNIAYALAICSFIFPILSLLGWLSGKMDLASFGSQFIPMAPSTAVCFILLCLSLLLLLKSTPNLPQILFVSTLGSLVAFYTFWTFWGLKTGLVIVPDELFLPDMGKLNGSPIGRMAHTTSGILLLSSISLLTTLIGLLREKHIDYWHNWAMLAGAIVALAGLIFNVGYALGSPLFYGGNVIPMALPTSLSFLFLGGSLLLAANSKHEFFDNWLKIKNISIKTQLSVGLSAILLLVILMGTVTWFVGESIWQETKGLYNHPLTVRRAIYILTTSVLSIQQDMNDLVFTDNEQERQALIQNMDILEVECLRQFDILRDRFLGNKSDVEETYTYFIQWKSIRKETIRLLYSGKRKEAMERTKGNGIDGSHQKKIIYKTRIISDFATNRGDKFYNDARLKKENLTISLAILLSVILLLTWFVSFQLLNSVKEPLKELIRATNDFKNENRNARSNYISTNEFGVLSASFNSMIDGIQMNTELVEKVATLASLMLSEYDVKKFFQSTLNTLADYTGSHMAAIYLLSNDKKTFEHFESIGLDYNARQSFAADRFEGEFGSVISSRKIQHIKNIPADIRFSFHTVSGKFIPHEIITLPIFINSEIIAIISLATISTYNDQSLQLIERILVTLSARIEGILAYQKIKDFSEKVEHQNRELESLSLELTRQNTELEAQKQQLSEVSRLKTSFLSNMSHELRTPLNSVIALSGVLSRKLSKKIPEEEYSYLEVIERNGKLLLGLINNILDISRIEAGREEVEVTKFSVYNLVTDVVNMIYPQARQKNIELIFTQGDSDLFLASDVDKCRHILQNLIGNAVKFTEKGKIEITTTKEDNAILIKVADTGIGISESYIPHIFEEFRQADSGTSRRFGGTGLGLAIAKKYAKLLGGMITVKSVLGIGSEFTLHLPFAYSEKVKAVEPAKSNELEHSIQPLTIKPVNNSLAIANTILLVENSEPAIIQMKDFLEESGYKLLIAHNGVEALGIINNFIPSAIILDLMMPGMDGFEVLRTIRNAESTAHIPVLILTAKHISKEELKFLKRNNIHQLIQKGNVSRKELQDAVISMVSPGDIETSKPKRETQTIEGKPIVLIVEDNADNMTTVKAILSDDFSILEANDGFEGVKKAKAYKPNLILMDIQLPGMNGIEAFKTIRKNGELQHIPIIALTASAMTSERETILAHGFDGYIAKPIDAHNLIKIIGESLYGK